MEQAKIEEYKLDQLRFEQLMEERKEKDHSAFAAERNRYKEKTKTALANHRDSKDPPILQNFDNEGPSKNVDMLVVVGDERTDNAPKSSLFAPTNLIRSSSNEKRSPFRSNDSQMLPPHKNNNSRASVGGVSPTGGDLTQAFKEQSSSTLLMKQDSRSESPPLHAA